MLKFRHLLEKIENWWFWQNIAKVEFELENHDKTEYIINYFRSEMYPTLFAYTTDSWLVLYNFPNTKDELFAVTETIKNWLDCTGNCVINGKPKQFMPYGFTPIKSSDKFETLGDWNGYV